MTIGEVRRWEYLTLPEGERTRLADLGDEGWGLVGVGGPPEARILYLKREGLDFRERVTLDQRRRYFEALGLDPGPRPEADQR
jgi:hypothetical protein